MRFSVKALGRVRLLPSMHLQVAFEASFDGVRFRTGATREHNPFLHWCSHVAIRLLSADTFLGTICTRKRSFIVVPLHSFRIVSSSVLLSARDRFLSFFVSHTFVTRGKFLKIGFKGPSNKRLLVVAEIGRAHV